ncbi:DNA polymerase III subunit chi [Sphingomonas parva]|uniref:DNA polymerase III subunit chi n=1 Tax=Sphingomonas parva TaxID=2555898 RepID=A0A4Y8ZVW1_9SPHN|nr:DNA polymerase III subunit chi [Sphingomonas parva]TFI60150.1 DNA polymerase III subunit chi [Sphingomonas parva]
MIVNFYHLARAPLERVLPSICEKLLGSGVRVLVVAGEDMLGRLDEQLWTYAKDSFLPHGRERAATQPVLLASEPAAANGARAIALADGVWREEALGFERIYYFFDEAGLDEARGLWRRLNGLSEIEPRYWKQDENGRWVQGP